jgi:hypothetical protein
MVNVERKAKKVISNAELARIQRKRSGRGKKDKYSNYVSMY